MTSKDRTRSHRLLALALVSAVSIPLFLAFVLLDPPRTWDSAPTVIVDNRGLATVDDSDGGVSATVGAITSNQAWNGAGSGTVVNAQGGSVASFTLGDGQPMINFQDPLHACTGNCLAATFTGFFSERSDGTFRIDDADIVTNTKRIDWTSESEDPNGAGCSGEFYIEGVMVHEVGHVLGLGHTDVDGATMFPSVSSCNNGPATTEQDDEDGLNALYSGGGPTPPPPSCLDPGESCRRNQDCCSGSCSGRGGNKTCA
jgi:hypothetical protein